MTEVLNFGGGRQTVAMCVLVEQGILPRPDYIVAADTGREVKTTWQYLEEHIQPRMAALGLEVIVAPHTLATVDLYGKNGDLLVPTYTPTGKLPTYCSVEWKRRVVRRELRKRGVDGASMWIGYSWDERGRAVKQVDSYWPEFYPLIDRQITRANCEQIILAAGLPLPHKSRCFMCPHQDDDEWSELSPEEWQAAVATDEELRDADDRGGVFLHHSRKPLADVVLEPGKADPTRKCQLGMCFV